MTIQTIGANATQGDLVTPEQEAAFELRKAMEVLTIAKAVQVTTDDEYVLSMDRAYQAFKQAGKTAKYQEFADKWAKNKNADPPHKVLQALADIVVKLETAAKKATTAA